MDLTVLLISVALLPLGTHLTQHTLTLEECSYLLTVGSFLIAWRFDRQKTSRSLLISMIIGGIFFVFGPVILDFAPHTLMRPWMRFPFGTNLYPNLESKQFLEIKVYENLTMESVYEVVSSITEPVLFRGSIRESETIGRRIVDRLATSDKRYMSQRFQARPYDFFRGSRFEAGLSANISEVLESKYNEYIGFEPLLTPEEGVELFGREDNGRIVDHTFLSNFKETIVTTFVHGASVSTSWSYQMVGKKTWFLWGPSFATPFNAAWFCRVKLPGQGDEFAIFSTPTIRVTVNAGDILVFPPDWYHAVVTHRGFNVMTTFRTKYGHWLPEAIPTVRFFTASLLLKFFGRNTPHYLPGIRKIRMENMQSVFTESPGLMRWDDPARYT
jgi:hypothetical protein